MTYPFDYAPDVRVGWASTDRGERWAIVTWAYTDEEPTQIMTFKPGSAAIIDGTLDKLPAV